METKKWICSRCGYIHTGAQPAIRCPVCGADSSAFHLQQHDFDSVEASPEGSLIADILVVGSGAAAFSAACTAKSLGADVIMFEKAGQLGGTSRRSGGGLWIPGNRWQAAAGYSDNREDCLAYMARCSYPHLFNLEADLYGLPVREYELLAAYVDNAAPMCNLLDAIGAMHPTLDINWTGKPQVDYFDHLPENFGMRGRTIFPRRADGTPGDGGELITQLSDWARAQGVQIKTGFRASRIVQNDEGRVTGLVVTADGRNHMATARRGVIFASGGFSHARDLMLHFQRGPHYGGCAVPENTGDFIRMAGEIGAQLGNMSGAFRAESIFELAVSNPETSSSVFHLAGDSVLVVNRYGQRIYDEKRNYADRAMTHFYWDPQKAEWTNLLTFLIFDQRTADLWQGFPPYPMAGDALPPWLIKVNDMDELRHTLTVRLHRLAPHTGGFRLATSFRENLNVTLSRFNLFAQTGKDLDFHRGDFVYDQEWSTFPPTVPDAQWPESNPNTSMYPLSQSGPYYAIILAAGTLDTNGGPLVDSHARVLDWQGVPIPGLYGAGNCIAAPAANAYWGAGGTLGPAMTFGYLAAKDAMNP